MKHRYLKNICINNAMNKYKKTYLFVLPFSIEVRSSRINNVKDKFAITPIP